MTEESNHQSSQKGNNLSSTILWYKVKLKTCINKCYGCINLKVIFQSAHRIKSFFLYKDVINRSQMSKIGC